MCGGGGGNDGYVEAAVAIEVQHQERSVRGPLVCEAVMMVVLRLLTLLPLSKNMRVELPLATADMMAFPADELFL